MRPEWFVLAGGALIVGIIAWDVKRNRDKLVVVTLPAAQYGRWRFVQAGDIGPVYLPSRPAVTINRKVS